MRRRDSFDPDALHFAPFLLLPSPFPRREFARSLRVQTVLNRLMHAVAHDRGFLEEALADTVRVDRFTGRLFDIFTTVWDEGLAQVRRDEREGERVGGTAAQRSGREGGGGGQPNQCADMATIYGTYAFFF